MLKNISQLTWSSFQGRLQALSKTFSLTLGFGIILLGLVLSTIFHFPFVSPLMASISGIIGTIVWYPALMEMKNHNQSIAVNNYQIESAVANARTKWELEEKKKIVEELSKTTRRQLRENEDLQMQLANLRATQMVATSWQQNWEMVLLEVEHKISNWLEKRLHDAESSIFSRAESHIYRGLLDKTFTAKLGFNLDRLRVHVPEGSTTLLVSMPMVSVVGVSNIKTEWRHKHVEVSFAEGTVRSGERQIHEHYRGLPQAAEEQSKQLEIRVNNGVDLEYLHDPVREMAKRILRSMLSPLHHDIEFVTELSVTGTPLAEFLDARRIEAEGRINELRARQHQVLEQMQGPKIAQVANA